MAVINGVYYGIAHALINDYLAVIKKRKVYIWAASRY